jgi:hypothetical protein
MTAPIYHIARSRQDGRYLVAHPQPEQPTAQYLLVFREDYDVLSYLNTHAPGQASQFASESLPASSLGQVLARWGFQGIGMVNDPLLPHVEFLRHDR